MNLGFRTYDDLTWALLKAYALFVPFVCYRTGDTSVAFVDILAPFTCLLIAMRMGRGLHPAYFLFLLYVGCAFVSLFAGASPGIAGVLLTLRILFISLPFWLAMTLERIRNEDLAVLFWFLLIGAGTGVALGVLMHFTGIVARPDEQQRLWLGTGDGPVYRAGGIVGEAGAYGQITAIFALALFSADRIGIRLSLPLRAAGWALAGVAFVASSSRGGMLMLAAGMAAVALLDFRKAITSVAALVAALMAAVLALAFSSGEAQRFLVVSLSRLDVLNLTGGSNFTETGRFGTWDMLADRALSVPLFGYGNRGFEDIIGRFIDNAFIITWFEVGPIGFIFFVLFWALALGLVLRDAIAFRSPFSIFAFGLLTSFLVRMQTGGAHTSWSTAPLVFLVAGLAIRHGIAIRTVGWGTATLPRPGTS